MSDALAPMPPFYSIAKVATLLDVCTRTVRNWIYRRELRAYGAGRQIRIAEADLQAFLEQRRK